MLYPRDVCLYHRLRNEIERAGPIYCKTLSSSMMSIGQKRNTAATRDGDCEKEWVRGAGIKDEEIKMDEEKIKMLSKEVEKENINKMEKKPLKWRKQKQ